MLPIKKMVSLFLRIICELANKIDQLVGNQKLLKKMGNKSYELSQSKYGWRKISDSMIKSYNKLLKIKHE